MLEDFLYDEKFWIVILSVLVIILILGIKFALIVIMFPIMVWIIFLWWNKYKIKIKK